MKTSFCSVAYRKTDLSLPAIIQRVAVAGYDAIEIWANHLPKSADGLDTVREIKQVLDNANLDCSMVAPYFDLTGSDQSWGQSVQTARHQIEVAKILGNKLIRAFTGARGSDDVNIDEWLRGVEGIQKIAEMAGAEGLTIALETHPRTLVDNISATMNFLEAVDMENVKLNLDIYHFWEVHKDPVSVLNAVYPFVAHIHAKNAHLSTVERETTPHPFLHDRQAMQEFTGIAGLEQGDMEYEPFLKRLQELDFEGFISVEWFGDDPDKALGQELAYLNKIIDEISGQNIGTAISLEDDPQF